MSEKFQVCWFSSYPGVSEEQMESLLQDVPWLSNQYQGFLRLTNGCVLEMFVFYGIGDDHEHPIWEMQFVAEQYGKDEWFVIGHDGAGDLFLLNRDGSVASVWSDPPPDSPSPVCSDVNTLIEQVCCGSRYSEYCGGRTDSDWFSFIANHGWTN